MKIEFINNQNVQQIIAKIVKNRFVAVDTEFESSYSYFPILALMQLCIDNKTVYIIDFANKAELDLAPIKEMLINPAVEKIFHSCKQDIEAIKYKFKVVPKNISDTQILAEVLKIGKQCGYATLIEQICNKQIDKTHQYSKWLKRPLTTQQIEYAAKDVLFLNTLYRKLVNKLPNVTTIVEYGNKCVKICNEKEYIKNPNKAWIRFKSKYQHLFANNDVKQKIKDRVLHREMAAMRQNKLPRFIQSDANLIQEVMSNNAIN
jgi:ribonuclease D